MSALCPPEWGRPGNIGSVARRARILRRSTADLPAWRIDQRGECLTRSVESPQHSKRLRGMGRTDAKSPLAFPLLAFGQRKRPARLGEALRCMARWQNGYAPELCKRGDAGSIPVVKRNCGRKFICGLPLSITFLDLRNSESRSPSESVASLGAYSARELTL